MRHLTEPELKAKNIKRHKIGSSIEANSTRMLVQDPEALHSFACSPNKSALTLSHESFSYFLGNLVSNTLFQVVALSEQTKNYFKLGVCGWTQL